MADTTSGRHPIAELAGVPLIGVRPVGWSQTRGVQPYQRIFESRAEDIDEIVRRAAGGPIDLRIGAGSDVTTWKGLRVVSTQPGRGPQWKALLVADSRIEWSKKTIIRSYNVRRRTGETRLVGEGRIETRTLIGDVAYKSWTLKDGREWRSREILEDVLQALVGSAYTIEEKALRREFPVQDLEISLTGAAALLRVLQYFSGISVRPEPDGSITVYDTRDGSERDALSRAGPILTNTGHALLSDKSFWRPEHIDVLYERECELRFDASITPGSTTVPRTGPAVTEPRLIVNVVANPDVEPLTVGGRTVGQSTWLPFPDWFGALPGSSHPTPVNAPADLSDAVVRQHWCAQFTFLQHLYALDEAGNRVPAWTARLRAVRRHWRQSWRIAPDWMQRIASVRAYRAAVIDDETGTRAPAAAFCDYLVKGSQHGIAKKQSEYHRLGWVVPGYADRLEDAELAPAAVSVIDEDNGILRVELQRDPSGEAEELIPGRCDELDLPSWDFSTSHAGWYLVHLDPDFGMAVVVTCVQGSPNSEKRYHRERITPQQAGRALGLSVGECRGEPMTILVRGGMLTARYAWMDSFAEQIEDAFITGADMPRNLLTNAEQIERMSTAVAARAYSEWIDRTEGSYAVPYNKDARVTGSISAVETIIEPTRGGVLTYIILAPELDPVDWEAMLPDSHLRTIQRMVQP